MSLENQDIFGRMELFTSAAITAYVKRVFRETNKLAVQAG